MNIRDLLSALSHYTQVFPNIEAQLESVNADAMNLEITSIEHDSRKVGPGSLFVAIEGTEFDSHSKISEAKDKGVSFVIGSKKYNDQIPDLIVEDSRAVLGPLSARLHSDISQKMKLVGVTGTNGKTTVTYLYAGMIRAHQESCFTMGTTGVLVDNVKQFDSQTTPDPLLIQSYFQNFYDDGIVNGVMEVSSHALEQLRVLGTNFAAVAFTNFSQDHLDYHLNMESYFLAKAKLFSTMYSPTAVINLDDEKSHEIIQIAKNNGQEIITVSNKENSADIYIKTLSSSLNSSELEIFIDNHSYYLITDIVGDYNFENIAVALGLSYAVGNDIEKSIEALKSPDIAPGRLQRVPGSNNFSVFVDYAHTPDSLKRVIDVVKPLAKRTVVVFGCGGDRDRAKRPIMGSIAKTNADIAIVTSDNPRSENPKTIIDEIVQGDESLIVIEDRKQAIAYALKNAENGDAIIIAGKGHEEGQIFADRVEEFSDIKVASECLKELNGV